MAFENRGPREFEPWFKYSESASSILYESVRGEGESKSLNFIYSYYTR